MDQRWESFLQGIVREAHGSSLPPALEEKMVADLSIQLHDQLHQLVFSLLPGEAQQLQYENLIMGNQASPLVLQEFLHPLIPNLDKHFEECLSNFRQDYLRICGTTN